MGRLLYVEQNDNWGKLGFVLHGDSLAYKRVLADNPGWDMTKIPSPGTVIYSSEISDVPKNLKSFPYVDRFGPERVIQEGTFPWSTALSRAERLYDYSESAITKVETVNRGY